MILPKEKLLRWRRNDPRDWAKYKKLRNTINKNIKTSKASYYSNAFGQSKGNPRKTWQTINELTCRRTNNRELKIETFSGRRQLQPDVTSSFVGYCACSCSPPCRRGSFQSGLFLLATKILQIIVLKLSLFSLRHISSSISKLCYLNLHLWMFCFHVTGSRSNLANSQP